MFWLITCWMCVWRKSGLTWHFETRARHEPMRCRSKLLIWWRVSSDNDWNQLQPMTETPDAPNCTAVVSNNQDRAKTSCLQRLPKCQGALTIFPFLHFAILCAVLPLKRNGLSIIVSRAWRHQCRLHVISDVSSAALCGRCIRTGSHWNHWLSHYWLRHRRRRQWGTMQSTVFCILAVTLRNDTP